jgi:hypothetical protein
MSSLPHVIVVALAAFVLFVMIIKLMSEIISSKPTAKLNDNIPPLPFLHGETPIIINYKIEDIVDILTKNENEKQNLTIFVREVLSEFQKMTTQHSKEFNVPSVFIFDNGTFTYPKVRREFVEEDEPIMFMMILVVSMRFSENWITGLAVLIIMIISMLHEDDGKMLQSRMNKLKLNNWWKNFKEHRDEIHLFEFLNLAQQDVVWKHIDDVKNPPKKIKHDGKDYEVLQTIQFYNETKSEMHQFMVVVDKNFGYIYERRI